MRKKIGIVIIGIMALSLVACGSGDKSDSATGGSSSNVETSTQITESGEVELNLNNWEDYIVLTEVDVADSSLKKNMAFRLKDDFAGADCKFEVKVRYSGHYHVEVAMKDGSELDEYYKSNYPLDEKSMEEEIGFYFLAGVDEPGFAPTLVEYDKGEMIETRTFITDNIEVISLEGYITVK